MQKSPRANGPRTLAAAIEAPATELKPSNLLGNIAALGVLQLSSYVIPVAITAYTARVLGVEAWGRLVLIQLVLSYFTLVVGWGFSWSATRKIASIQNDREAVSAVAIATVTVQGLLALLMVALLVALVATVPFFARDAQFYLYGLGTILGAAIFPAWLLTGLERMREFSIIQISSRIFALLAIMLLVKTRADAPRVIAVNALAALLAAAATLLWLRRSALLTWHRPALSQIREQFRDGGGIFLSTTSIGLYVTLTPILLGTLLGPAAAGYFVLADRIRTAAQAVLAPISNALFPRISRLIKSDPKLADTLLQRSGLGLGLISLLISLALFLGADLLVGLFGGRGFGESANILRWLALLPFVMSFSTFFGLQVFLPNGRIRAFNFILGSASLLSLLMIVPLISWGGIEGAALTLCATEFFVSVAMTAYLLRTGFFSGTWKNVSPAP